MKTSTVIAATGFGVLASTRAIPVQSTGQSMSISQSQNTTVPSARAIRRANSLNPTQQTNLSSSIAARTQGASTIIVNATRSAGQDRHRQSRSSSLSSTSSDGAGATSRLESRKHNYNNYGNGRYIPDKNCPETGIWDTRAPGRCKTKQDDIDAANEAKKETRTAIIGGAVTAGVCGPIVLGGAIYGIRRCMRKE